MQSHLVLLFLALLAAVCAVQLEETVIPDGPEEVPVQDEENDQTEAPTAEDTAQVLEELEHQIFDQVVRADEVAPNPRAKTTRRCCKLGRQVAQNGLFCNLDLLQVQKRPNVVHRRKMKFHGPEVHGKTVYKDLMRRVEKCALSNASESMFVKCCEWQRDIIHDLEQCKLLDTLSERRRCRRRVQARQ
ncbi:uncharacterized protein LOC110980216 isoform X2 [Acanthaster planci]|uniref:Uncharacterized protein LOC110980216 isoform X2 n=1 Tax=Acanthaster planci TaxID=133434 RepID=A0A8B7YGJ6_ACAPL|nr:uncharacterized protein LOC110980216 isoform X2 [Acanthaster planci]